MIKVFILYSLLWAGIILVILPMILETVERLLDKKRK